jgi:hypothetical protein
MAIGSVSEFVNTSALKTFAPSVRLQLMEAVTRKLDFVLTGDTAELRAMNTQRATLRREADRDRSGLIERVAYTWFNRLTALRFLDAHGWHPFRARVLTPANPEESLPELLKVMRTGALPPELASFTNPKRLNDLLDGHRRFGCFARRQLSPVSGPIWCRIVPHRAATYL